MKKPKPKKKRAVQPETVARKLKKARKVKQQPAERDHEFNPEDVARLNND